jgi:leader peptidase (prepilin peptidase)/N-methyltransferase
LWFLYLLAFFMGSCFMSFGMAMVFRYTHPEITNIRSVCEGCGEVLSPLSLLPIWGFLYYRGKAPCCGFKIPWKYPALEFIGGLVGLGLFVLWTFTRV